MAEAQQDSRERGYALIEQVIDQLSSISARAMNGSVPEDPSDLYTACGEMQLTLQEAMMLLQTESREEALFPSPAPPPA